jgi:hypothetical protein
MKPQNPSYVQPDIPQAGGYYAQVLLPKVGRNERAFASETGQIIGPLNVAFLHNDRVAEIYDEPVPVVKTEELDRNNLARGGLKFRTMTGIRTKGWIEQYLTTGIMIKETDDNGTEKKTKEGKPIWRFAEKTMSKDLPAALLENPSKNGCQKSLESFRFPFRFKFPTEKSECRAVDTIKTLKSIAPSMRR